MRFSIPIVRLLISFCLALTASAEAFAAEPTLIAQGKEGALQLHASNVVVHGTMLRYEPQTNKNCLGYWTKAEDWAEWTFEIRQADGFVVEVWQGCGKGQVGSDVAVEVGGKRFDFAVEDTGHFQNFVPRKLGRVPLAAGRHALAIRPQHKQAASVTDIREVRLVPVEREAKPAGALTR